MQAEIARNTIAFLDRVNITGDEAEALIQCKNQCREIERAAREAEVDEAIKTRGQQAVESKPAK